MVDLLLGCLLLLWVWSFFYSHSHSDLLVETPPLPPDPNSTGGLQKPPFKTERRRISNVEFIFIPQLL